MKKMRIVGLNKNNIFVQKQTRMGWEQELISHEAFDQMMRTEYPAYYQQFEASGTEKSAAEWFYNFGETEEMMRKGEAFIF